jgi:hypothetical protein
MRAKPTVLTSEQIRAARALLRWESSDLARAAKLSVTQLDQLESAPGMLAAAGTTVDLLRQALEAAGIQFLADSSGGIGVRLRSSRRDEGLRPDQLTSENDD